MSQQQQFESLLAQLMSEENETRTQAERFFNQTKASQPNELAQALLQVGRTSKTSHLKSFAIILLRRLIVEDKQSVNEQTMTLIKRELLTGLERETDKQVLSTLRDTVVDFAENVLEDEPNAWNELLEWIIRLAQSTDGNHKQTVLSILSRLSAYVADVFLDKFYIVKNLLLSGFQDPDIQVKITCLDAATGFIQVFNQSAPRKEMQAMVPLMLDIIAFTLNNRDEPNAQTALKHFIDIGELDAGFLKNSASMVTDAMIKIGQATTLEENTRQLALEFLITFIENKPTLSKNIPGFVGSFVLVLLQIMLDMEETTIEEWNETKDDEDQDDIPIVAQEILDRLCLALKGDSIVPVIFEHIPKFVASKENWKCRHVGLMALSMIGEGCSEFLKPHLDKIIGMILPLFSDENPRVRWAAANTAGQMSTDFGPKFQRNFHTEIIPRLAQLLDDTANPKVQSHAAAALVNFCEKFEGKLLVPYLHDILSKLLNLLKNQQPHVKEQAITAVASIAGCAEKHFVPYYDSFFPILKEIIVNSVSKELRMVRAKTIECVSLVAIAVGKEKFKPDVVPVMDLLGQIQNSGLDVDDPQREFILQAWTRISTCLGEDFVPYLKFVMPPLIQTASQKAGVHVIDDNNEQEEEGWDYVTLGDSKLAIHTSALEEKASACNLLLSYASEMKEGFFPYVEEVSKVCVPLMSFYYHDGVRLAALSIMPQLIQSTRLYLEKNSQDKKLLHELFGFIYPSLIAAISGENDEEVLVVAIESLHEVLEQMGPNTLAAEKVTELVGNLKTWIIEMQKRRAEILARKPDDGDGEESLIVREELEKEDNIAVELAEVVAAIVKHHPQYFLTCFDSIFPLVLDMLQPNKASSERQFAVCVFDDIVEHTREQSLSLFGHFLPLMMQYASDPHPGVRQAACFGLGVCAQFGGEMFKPVVRQCVEALVNVINQPDSRQDRNTTPTENAISSIGKILLFQADVIQEKMPDLVDLFVNWMPISVDWLEARVVHQQLIEMLRRYNTMVFGKDFKNLPKILSIFAEIVPTEPTETALVTQQTINDIVQVLQTMQKQFPGQLLQQAFLSVNPENQVRLQNIMSGKISHTSASGQ